MIGSIKNNSILKGFKDISQLQKKEIVNKRGKKQTVYVSYNHENYIDKQKEGNFVEAHFHHGYNNFENVLKHKLIPKSIKNLMLKKHFDKKLGKGKVLGVQHYVEDDGSVSLRLKMHKKIDDVNAISKLLEKKIAGYKGLRHQFDTDENPAEDNEQFYHHQDDAKDAISDVIEVALGGENIDDANTRKHFEDKIKLLRNTFGSNLLKRILKSQLIAEYHNDEELKKHYTSYHEFINDFSPLFEKYITGWKEEVKKPETEKKRRIAFQH